MKIRSVEIRQFRKFAKGVRLTGFGDGLNVLAGPNEIGKSTIVAALQGILFEKHRARTDSVMRMRTLGSETSPSLALDFGFDGGEYRLEKTFLSRQPSARLSAPGGRVFEGDDAEIEVQRILGFSSPGKRGADEESQGIWGLLWVEQGASIGPPKLAESGLRTLRECLEYEVGGIAGGQRGRRLVEQVEVELAKLVDGRKKPKDRWKQVIEEIETKTRDLAEAEATRAAVNQDLESLAQKKRDRRELDADGEEEKLTKDLSDAKRQLEEAREADRKLERARDEVVGLARERDSIASELKERKDFVSSIASSDEELALANDQLGRAKTEVERRKSLHAKLSVEEKNSKTNFEAGRAEREKLEAAKRLADVRAVVGGLNDALTAAKKEEQKVQDFEGRVAAIRVTDEILRKVRKSAEGLLRAKATLDALSTRISFEIEPSARSRVRIDGKPLAKASDELNITTPTTLSIKEVGEIRISPGAKDLSDADKALRLAEGHLGRDLAAAGVATVEEAEALLDEKKRLGAAAEAGKKQIETLTGPRTIDSGRRTEGGIEDLARAVSEMQAQIENLEAKLGGKTKTSSVDLEARIDAAKKAERKLENEREALLKQVEEAAKSVAGAEEALQSVVVSVGGLEATKKTRIELLSRRREASTDEQLGAKLGNLQLDLTAKEEAAALLERLAKEREPSALVESRVVRLESARAAREQTRQQLEREIATLDGKISVQMGMGIDERVAGLKGDLESRECERTRLESRAEALGLLRDELDRAEKEAKERYLAPITQRIEPYLHALFPEARLRCDENFQLESLERSGRQAEEFDRLSGGTQEQIAVLTRLAFADLLTARGRPAALILDDALAYSDSGRLERMFDILTRATKSVQIVVLTCREKAFARLGGNRLQIEELT